MTMPLLEVKNLTKHFDVTDGLISRWFDGGKTLKAVDQVSFSVPEGKTFGLVGESGCGKSTTARLITKLLPATGGEVFFQGRDILQLPNRDVRELRKHIQMIFQDPYASLNPRMRVVDIVGRPLTIFHGVKGRKKIDRVGELLELVGLSTDHLYRYPHEFSGGQRQRIGIARALALNPALIIADEAVSALDVSIQAQVVRLMLDLRERLKLTYLFIAHDLRLVEHICSRVAVMYLGKLVEVGDTRALFANPAHPYTRALLSAVPVLDPDATRQRISLDPASFDREAPLREIGASHWAAV
jgi:ABC-type oligopeptide transport system ATPase subunit